MRKLFGALLLVLALSWFGLPAAMAASASVPETAFQKDDDDKDGKKKRRHHKHHKKHHHHRHHKHPAPATTTENS
jgi:Spy/CpxP family protein refolding chaperone